jgi:hypothetical protein
VEELMTREVFINATDLRVRLHEVLTGLTDRPALLIRHSRPEAVMLNYNEYVGLLDRIEDLEDRLAVFEGINEGEDLKVPFAKVAAEAGLMAEDD